MGHLSRTNSRQQIEQDYSVLFSTEEGCPALSARMAFGALIINERLGTSDRETLEQTLPPQGQLIVDATCAPADIKYPTDLNLLNEACEKAEAMIDTLHAPFVGQQRKPRTCRQEARKAYLAVAKKKNRESVRFAKPLVSSCVISNAICRSSQPWLSMVCWCC